VDRNCDLKKSLPDTFSRNLSNFSLSSDSDELLMILTISLGKQSGRSFSRQ
jgi:hypothetical protein